MKKEVVETALVAPSEEMRRKELWLSNLDLRFPHAYTNIINYYPAAAEAGPAEQQQQQQVDRLKLALAKALVPFYPLAGRLSLGVGDDDNGGSRQQRRHVDCNGEGVQLVVVRADVAGAELFDDYQPSPEVAETFVPAWPPPPEELPCNVALFQVTFLKCGGVVLASCFHHAVVDATSVFHFMQTWSRLARGVDAAEAVGPQPPLHDRTCVRVPPQPPVVPPPVLAANATTAPAADKIARPRPPVTRTYPVPLKLIDELKSRCGSGSGGGVSTFSAIAAHVWRCMCVARGVAMDADTCLGLPVNVRQRLRPPLPPGFFGNAVVHAFATARVGDVADGSPASVARMVRDAVASVWRVQDDAAAAGAAPAPAPPTKPAESIVAMISWLRMPLYDADFGWGTPQLVMRVLKSMFSGMVFMLPRGHDKESGVTLLLSLEPDYLPAFEKLLYDAAAVV